MVWIIFIEYLAWLIFEYKINASFVSTILFTLLPYAVIAFLNNVFMTKIGYYYVENQTLLIIGISALLIIIGSNLARLLFERKVNIGGKMQEYCFDDVMNGIENNITKIIIWLLFCYILRLLQLFMTIRRIGITGIVNNDYSNLALSGLPSHLFLTTYPLSALMFLYGIKKKKNIQ